jgi:hypothetical protein
MSKSIDGSIGRSTTRSFAAVVLVFALLFGGSAGLCGQIVDNPGFAAQLRPINYATPLAPANGVKAVIVYGKDAPWTKTAAEAVQKAIADWSGVKLELADDRTVTSDDTWLLTDAYRKTPLVVLGNSQDNRVMHALGTRYLLQSNRTWPGGDRYYIRSVFEPFVADVNYVVLEASNQSGMDAAAAKFADLIKTFPGANKATATVPPRLRVLGGVTNKWIPEKFQPTSWNPPLAPELAKDLSRSPTELAKAFQGTPLPSGWGITRNSNYPPVWWYILGGYWWSAGQDRTCPDLDDGTLRATAAMYMLGCRKVGGRAYPAMDHYGAATFLVYLRSIFQTGLLSDKEVNELESAIVLSSCDPNDYVLNNIGSGNGIVGGIWSGRHSSACMLTASEELDYVRDHCRIDDRTRREVERRYDGVRKSVTSYLRSFRGNHDDSCLGEDTVLQFYSQLQMGFMDNIRNGMLRKSADMYIMTSDNIPYHYIADPHIGPCYAGLSGFSSSDGGEHGAWEGASLVCAAAFYYDDPQYRWFVQNRGQYVGSEAAFHYGMHPACEMVGPAEMPTRYLGVRALPMDERIFDVLSNPQTPGRMEVRLRIPPDLPGKALDRVSFRDGFDRNDAYLYLAASQDMFFDYPTQNNSIARYSDLNNVWLYSNTYDGSTWSRSVVNCSTGGNFVPRAACQLEALANLGDISMVASTEVDSGGADWTRSIVHVKGHYFAVLDRLEARNENDYTFTCRWRSLQSAALANGIWTARAPGGNALRVQSAEDVVQTHEAWPCDGASNPAILQQFKNAHLLRHQEVTFRNLLYVSGRQRPDEFQAKAVGGSRAMLVKGKTKDGEHLAMIGVNTSLPFIDVETDAQVFIAVGNQLRLAGAKTLRTKVNDVIQEVFWSQTPVNALVDFGTGKAQVEVLGDKVLQAKIGQGWVKLQPGMQTVTLADGNSMYKLGDALARLWPTVPPPSGAAPQPAAEAQAFDAKTSDAPLARPLPRLTDGQWTPGPASADNEGQTWNDPSKLELVLTFPKPTEVGCLRLVGPPSNKQSKPPKVEFYYNPDDFKFSLVLSDDGFQKDVRKVDPKVIFEETPRMGAGHFYMVRYPTWRIEIGATAKEFKLLLRPSDPARAFLKLKELQVYGPKPVDQLTAKAIAADIDGDGANELVLATSQKELAAYDATGKQLWHHVYDGDIHDIIADDLDGNGKRVAIALLDTEKLHRVNGDGAERAVADINTVCTRGVNIFSMAAWSPQGPGKKEVMLWCGEPSSFKVLPDGAVKASKAWGPQASLRLANFYPGEPEAMSQLSSGGLMILSPRCDKDGNWLIVGNRAVTGSNSGNEACPPGVLRQFCQILPVEAKGSKWLVGAVASGLNCYPVESFAKGAKEEGWQYNTGGPCGVAVLAEDINADGVPEVLFARQDGFINVFRLADGFELGRISVGEPIIGMAMVKVADGKQCLAVCTKFSVQLFAPAATGAAQAAFAGAGLTRIGKNPLPATAAAFAGPGGPNKDCVFVIDSAGAVTVFTPKPH